MRLLVPQFKDVQGGVEVDRALDVSEIDAAFARVANVLNGNIDTEALASGTLFSIGAVPGTIQSAFACTKSMLSLSGRCSSQLPIGSLMVLGVTSLSTWTAYSVEALVLVATQATPTISFWNAGSLLAGPAAATQITVEEAERLNVPIGQFAYRIRLTELNTTNIPAGTIITMSSNVALESGSCATIAFSAPHLS